MAKRVLKTSRFKTVARRRQADLRRRKRKQEPRKPTPGEIARKRRNAVRRYRHLKEVMPTEDEAARQTTRECKTSSSTIRRWDLLHRQGGLKALIPQSKRPHTIHYRTPLWVQGLVVLLRVKYGWGQHRISAELKRRDIYSLSHKGVRKILDHHPGVKIKVYHLRAKSDGIAYQRWGRSLPNTLWHIDFKESIRLENGEEAHILVLVDARSHYCVACVAQIGEFDTEQTRVACQKAFEQFGLCDAMISDNGRIFTSNYENSTTRFSQWLEEQGVRHLRTTPYYPEGNGKAKRSSKP